MSISTPKVKPALCGPGRVAPAVLAAVVALVLAGCGADEGSGEEQTLKLTDAGDTGEFHPVGDPWPEANKPGGGFVFAIPLDDYVSGERAGELNGVCIFTNGEEGKGTHVQCSETADVPGGQLAIDVGGKARGQTTSGAISGGSGNYAGATGTYESVREEVGTTHTFELTLP